MTLIEVAFFSWVLFGSLVGAGLGSSGGVLGVLGGSGLGMGLALGLALLPMLLVELGQSWRERWLSDDEILRRIRAEPYRARSRIRLLIERGAPRKPLLPVLLDRLAADCAWTRQIALECFVEAFPRQAMRHGVRHWTRGSTEVWQARVAGLRRALATRPPSLPPHPS